ncbi:uncharacterized protein LOC121626440 [Chelmon rostratus]|uniref:uncharacterized protein LOC121626440 n=1 Tax=Chelmon rostratus TaxID=109905 RepID=UPI001BE646C8|nr:uncharacterized protein LOC121626440 [Chelmon rostratus]
MLSGDEDSESFYHDHMPNVRTSLECHMFFSDYSDTSSVTALAKFGTQAVLYFYFNSSGSFSFEALVDGEVVDTFTVQGSNVEFIEGYFDISGCRHSDVMYKPGTNASDPQTCFSLTCNETAALRTTECGPLDRCQGNGVCMFDPICTVTGPAVIDFNDQLKTVEDRCGYTLLTGSSIQNLTVVANFRERRRRDVSFLDSVTLRLQGQDDVHLEQGGIVKEGNTTLTINGSTDLGNGVEVFVDPTGVTVTVSHPESTTSVFFDGNTAQIIYTGPAELDPELGGLCANSSASVSDERLVDHYAEL